LAYETGSRRGPTTLQNEKFQGCISYKILLNYRDLCDVKLPIITFINKTIYFVLYTVACLGFVLSQYQSTVRVPTGVRKITLSVF